MPELPDLQVFSKNLLKRIEKKNIKAIKVFNNRNVNLSEEEIRAKLIGKQILDITRLGKELYFHSNDNEIFSVHLMLSGKFDICNKNELNKIYFRILSIEFDDDFYLVISDMQSLCKVTFSPQISDVPDALCENFSYDYFLNVVKSSQRKNIKAFLINQDIVKGIGNAYVDEILYNCNISPESTTGKIPPEYLKKLYDSIHFILVDAIENI